MKKITILLLIFIPSYIQSSFYYDFTQDRPLVGQGPLPYQIYRATFNENLRPVKPVKPERECITPLIKKYRSCTRSTERSSCTTHEQQIIISNKSSVSITANISRSHTSSTGFFDVTILPGTTRRIDVPELSYFSPSESFCHQEQLKKVRMIKHGYADTLQLIIPNQAIQQFTIPQKGGHILVLQDASGHVVSKLSS